MESLVRRIGSSVLSELPMKSQQRAELHRLMDHPIPNVWVPFCHSLPFRLCALLGTAVVRFHLYVSGLSLWKLCKPSKNQHSWNAPLAACLAHFSSARVRGAADVSQSYCQKHSVKIVGLMFNASKVGLQKNAPQLKARTLFQSFSPFKLISTTSYNSEHIRQRFYRSRWNAIGNHREMTESPLRGKQVRWSLGQERFCTALLCCPPALSSPELQPTHVGISARPSGSAASGPWSSRGRPPARNDCTQLWPKEQPKENLA